MCLDARGAAIFDQLIQPSLQIIQNLEANPTEVLVVLERTRSENPLHLEADWLLVYKEVISPTLRNIKVPTMTTTRMPD